MYDFIVLSEWIEFAVRWLHVITAIAWIGSSFYFIALDLGLHRDRNLASGADDAPDPHRGEHQPREHPRLARGRGAVVIGGG